ENDRVMRDLAAVEKKYAERGKLGPVARLMPTTAATTLRKSANESFVLDGPFAETKEQFLGFFVIEAETLDEAITFARELAVANPGAGAYEIRPLRVFKPGGGTP
ncbi:YciI family protein, partial [Rhizobium sp. TRM95111]|uniref:YciI family protein n=1 Tax=Rhizobium alarense TaxID=2846851 RepID=UPI001F2A6C90